MITVTEKAAEKIKSTLKSSEFRLGVQGGGCSGLQYSFISMGDAPQQEDDLVFESNGVKVVVDRISIKYLDGAEIDWLDSPVGGQPVFKNPHADGTCGCGQSFNPKE